MDTLVRTPEPREMEGVFLMGFDAWAGGKSRERYLAGCRNSPHYRQGRWYVLAPGGEIVSSLITYQDLFRLPPGCHGIGSVATVPACRGQGHGSRLVRSVVGGLATAGSRGVFLFSEVGERFYRDLGFSRTANARHANGSLCMLRAFEDGGALRSHTPDYF